MDIKEEEIAAKSRNPNDAIDYIVNLKVKVWKPDLVCDNDRLQCDSGKLGKCLICSVLKKYEAVFPFIIQYNGTCIVGTILWLVGVIHEEINDHLHEAFMAI